MAVGEMEISTLGSLPLGFRFRPTDEELIDYYLRFKINGQNDHVYVIREIDVCKWEPWDLPDLSMIPTKDPEWFFFCPQDRKYPNGNRLNRATNAGYWKATGKDRKIKSRTIVIGMKKTLVFHIGRAPKGKRTNWVMHEYRPTLKELDGTNPGQSAFVLCRLFKKQDESIEGSNSDDAELIVSSHATIKSPPDDTLSEVALAPGSPSSGKQAEKHSMKIECIAENSEGMTPEAVAVSTQIECSVAENSEGMTPVAVAVTECPSNSYNACEAGDQENSSEMDSLRNIFVDPLPVDSKIFSPLHSQLQAELGSPFLFYSDSNDDCRELQFQYGTDKADDISDFLNSIIDTSGENSSVDLIPQNNRTNRRKTMKSVFEAEHQGSGISEGNIETQAPIHSLNVLEAYGENASGFGTTHLKVTQLSNDSGAVIHRKSRLLQNPSSSSNIMVQGDAPRRILFQTRISFGNMQQGCIPEEESKQAFGKEEEASEQDSTGSCAASDMEEPLKAPLLETLGNIETSQCFRGSKPGKKVHFMYSVAVVLVLFIIFIAIWRCLEL